MKKKNVLKRILAIALAVVMVASGLPDMGRTASAASGSYGVISTVDDPHTMTRPVDTYGNNTLNAGKILVGKSVTDGVDDDDPTKSEELDISKNIFKQSGILKSSSIVFTKCRMVRNIIIKTIT